MPLKPIRRINIRRQVLKKKSKIPEKKSKLDSFVESLPDFDKKELRIIKINDTYYEISKDRTEHSVGGDALKYTMFLNLEKRYGKIYSVKDIHTHIGDNPLPSITDILTTISLYLHTPQALSFPILVIDPNTKRICGRSIVYLGKDSIQKITKDQKLQNLKEEIIAHNIISKFDYYLSKNQLIASGKKLKSGEIINRYLKDAKSFRTFQYEYLKSKFGYKIKFQPYPGYRFDRNTMTFKKI
ncbi:MAG: hypothetical protein WCX82_04695 [archaeon]|jgi:hypothetical protein